MTRSAIWSARRGARSTTGGKARLCRREPPRELLRLWRAVEPLAIFWPSIVVGRWLTGRAESARASARTALVRTAGRCYGRAHAGRCATRHGSRCSNTGRGNRRIQLRHAPRHPQSLCHTLAVRAAKDGLGAQGRDRLGRARNGRGVSTYRSALRKLRQGDIAICEFHQLRARSGEGRGPGDAQTANEDLPYLGEHQDFEIPIEIPGREGHLMRVLRIWIGPVVIVSQSCELEYADEQDARVLVSPIVSEPLWPNGPWELIERGTLPGYLYVPPLSDSDAGEFGLDGPWPQSAVVLASTTLVSKAIVGPNRIMALSPAAVTDLQAAIVRFTSVRGWGDVDAARALQGKHIVDVRETVETVPGPSRLTKVMLDGPDGGDEITVVCGLRPTRRAA